MKKIVSLCLMLVMSMMIWADRTLYFVPNSNWTQSNAKFAVYCFENEESEWSDFMTLVAGETNVYTTTIPDSYTQVIFCRMNSAAIESDWGYKWNQSADITLPTDGKDMFTLADGWDQINGTWSVYGVQPQPAPHFYLTGDDAFVGAGKAAWNKDDAYVSYSDTLTLNLAAGSYEMKLITPDDQWIGYESLTQPVTAGITTNSYQNICFTLAQADDVTFIYNANLFKVEGTFAVPEYHFYYVGTNNGWDPETAIEFTNADTAYTLAMDSLYGEFKIMTVRGDWSSLSYGANDQSAQVSAGVPYVMAEWAANNMVVNGVFANVTLSMTLVEGVATITIIAQNDTTSGPEYYIKNNWDGATEWTWQQMEALPGEIWQYVDVYGGTGVNVNTVAEDNGAIWFAESDWDIANNFVPQAGDTLMFWFIPADTLLRVHLIGRPGGDPLPVENHYYLIGNYNEWNIQTSQEFTKQGDIYTITIDTLFGEFKVMTTRSWNDLSYGRGDNDGVLTMGEAYAMVEWASDNMSIEGIYTNAVLNLQVTENAATLTFVSGTLVEDPVVVMVEVRLVPGVWDLDGAKFAAVTWNEGETMEENGVFSAWMLGTDTVSTMIPADADSIAFGRLNPEAEEPAMEYVWNHTDKLAIDPSLIYTITGWGEAGADCSTGYWGDPVPVDPQGLDVVAMDGNEAVKALQNGVLYIYRNGHKYNVQGQIIR